MYVPGHFAAADLAFCHRVIREYPFAPIATPDPAGELIVSHLPFVLDPDRGPMGTLVGHVARASPHAEAIAAGTTSIVVFTGPHAYVSPTWYETHPAVPTWNYCAVHISGIARVLDEPTTRAYLIRLARHFEGPATTAWRFEAQPEEFQAKMMRGIVAFDLEISQLQGKAKLSQNRPQADVARVIAALEASSAPADAEVARWMSARRD